MLKKELIQFLKKQLQLPLPGKTAQYKMATKTRMPYKNTFVPKNARIACVLCLLYPKNGEWHLPLIQRVITEHDKHSGQISFPGGKLELSDLTYQDGALRETKEEIGIPSKDVFLLGHLTPLYVPISNFQVHPFVGFLDYTPTFIPQESEVAEVVEVSLKKLIAPRNLKYKSMQFNSQLRMKEVPYFDVSNKTVWGATAMMLNELVEIVGYINNSTIKYK